MKLICSQPSTKYSEWQLLILIESLRKFEGKLSLDIILMGENLVSLDKLSKSFHWLKIYYYKDVVTRRKDYLPNNKIYGYIKHWAENPLLESEYYLFIDADCLILSIPQLPRNNIHYGADISKIMHQNILLENAVSFKSDVKPIGLFYYGKGYTKIFWESVYDDAYIMFDMPVVQNKWICEMRSWFYNLIKFNFQVLPHEELNCSDGIKFGKNVYHHIQHLFFNKVLFKDKYPWGIIPPNNIENFSSIMYFDAIKECENNLLNLI
jgi:hypothetical protein